MTTTNLDEFTTAYIEAALWSSTDSDGDPLDANYDIRDIAPGELEKIVHDCQIFQASPHIKIEGREAQAGHDFYLTRCGAGCGFWDGDWDDDEDNAKALTAQSKGFGEADLYVGDDGKLYLM